MTEKEKSLLGLVYNPLDYELIINREKTKSLLFKYNNLNPLEYKKRKDLITELLGNIKGDICIEQPFFCTYGDNISVGNNFFANVNCKILDAGRVNIGNNVLIAPNVCIITEEHEFDFIERNKGFQHASPVTIEDNVWICTNATILPNVTIGKNSIIGAGSVVTKDIPPNSVAVGNPCKVIRNL